MISILDIHLPKRYSTHIVKVEDNNSWRPIFIYYDYSMYYGQDFAIADNRDFYVILQV